EGLLGQTAERVLSGELPHRDFDDVYTGGLSFLNAIAFRVFGTTLAAPRYVLLLFCLSGLAATFYIASRFATALAAAGITLLTAAWGVPNYNAAMPSWYNLFFALFGVAALLRHLETGRARWLFVAGLCGGLSVTIKISGLYFVAAAVLYLLTREQSIDRERWQGPGGKLTVYSLFVAAGLATFVAGLFRMIGPQALNPTYMGHYIVPSATIALAVGLAEIRTRSAFPALRFKTFFRMLAPLLAGVALPLLAFLAPYALTGSVGALVEGIFVAPFRRTQFAYFPPPGIWTSVFVLPALALLIAACVWHKWIGAPTIALVGVIFALLLVLPLGDAVMCWKIWLSVGAALPLAIPLSLALLGRAAAGHAKRDAAFLLLATTAVCSLIIFPFAAPTYFHYISPLTFLSVFAIGSFYRPRRELAWALGAFYLVFMVTYESSLYMQLRRPQRYPDQVSFRLDEPRAGGLRVRYEEAAQYRELLPLVRAHAGPSAYIYAGPDAPEVYFLSGLKNPTRTLFDFLSRETPASTAAKIESHDVRVAVIRNDPQFSRFTPEFREYLDTRLPHSAPCGRFEVRWRE